MPASAMPVVGPRRHRPSTRRIAVTTLRYLLLTVLAVIVLFPLYMTVVNSLLKPSQIAARPPTFFPTNPAVEQLQRGVERRPHGPVPA